MIGQFPTFKPLQLDDRVAVQTLTRPFPPYSDFNFTSLYCRDTNEQVRVAVLNGNLAVRFTDPTTDEPFYSFIGNRNVDDTVSRLLDLATSEGLARELKRVPESCVWRATPGRFAMREDKANFDHVVSVDRLKTWHIQPQQNSHTRSDCAVASVEVNLADVAIQSRFLALFHRWALRKDAVDDAIETELMALHRVMFAARRLPDLCVIATFVDDDLCGFAINEVLGDGYGIILFDKADFAYAGIYPQLMQQMAGKMGARDCRFINYEQGLGVGSQRKAGSNYLPSNCLRKYVVG